MLQKSPLERPQGESLTESMTYIFIIFTAIRYTRGEHEEKEETDPGDTSASEGLLGMLQERPLERPQGESPMESMTYLFIFFTFFGYARGEHEEKEETGPGDASAFKGLLEMLQKRPLERPQGE